MFNINEKIKVCDITKGVNLPTENSLFLLKLGNNNYKLASTTKDYILKEIDGIFEINISGTDIILVPENGLIPSTEEGDKILMYNNTGRRITHVNKDGEVLLTWNFDESRNVYKCTTLDKANEIKILKIHKDKYNVMYLNSSVCTLVVNGPAVKIYDLWLHDDISKVTINDRVIIPTVILVIDKILSTFKGKTLLLPSDSYHITTIPDDLCCTFDIKGDTTNIVLIRPISGLSIYSLLNKETNELTLVRGRHFEDIMTTLLMKIDEDVIGENLSLSKCHFNNSMVLENNELSCIKFK